MLDVVSLENPKRSAGAASVGQRPGTDLICPDLFLYDSFLASGDEVNLSPQGGASVTSPIV